MRHVSPTALGLAAILAIRSSFAAGGAPRDPAAAEVLFRAGRSLAVAGDYARACPKFEESLRLEHAPGTLLNLADCEERTGLIARAWAHFRALSTELPSSDERQPFASRRADALESRLPRLTVRSFSALPSGAKVERDGVELGRESLDLALPVDPGTHTVVVMEGDRERFRSTIDVREGQSRVVRADVAVEGHRDDADASAGSRGAWNPTRTAGWITAGLAAAALATGTSFGISALSTNGASEAHCAGNGVCSNATSAREYDDARSQARVADVALGIGLVAAVVAGSLLLTTSSSGKPRSVSSTLVSVGLLRCVF